jgi:hypothetical protein
MVSLPSMPFNSSADYAIASLFTGMAVESAVTLASRANPGALDLASVAVLTVFAIVLVHLWWQLFLRKRGAFSVAGWLCGLLFVAQRLLQGLAAAGADVSPVTAALSVCFTSQVLLATFLTGFAALRQIRKDPDDDESPATLLSGIGYALLIAAVAGAVRTWPSPPEVFAHVVCGVIGFGCVVREGKMALGVLAFASAMWIGFAFIGGPAGMPLAHDWGFASFLAALAVALYGFLRPVFAAAAAERDHMEASGLRGNDPGSSLAPDKKCSHCGRPVPFASRTGQHCPHCGVYWSYEDQWDSRK